MGEVTVAESVGLEIVSGKSSDPFGGGCCAGGAGKSLELGDHVMGTGGVEGYVGWVGGGGAGGVGSFTACLGLEPQLVNTAAPLIRRRAQIRE